MACSLCTDGPIPIVPCPACGRIAATWRIRTFAIHHPAQTLAGQSFDSELEARAEFDRLTENARVNGGGHDLIHGTERVARVQCIAENE